MSRHSTGKRMVEERVSSYKRHFGESRSLFDYAGGTPRKTMSHSLSRRGFGVSSSRPCVDERVSYRQSIPVSSGVSMTEINNMEDSLGEKFQGMRTNEKAELQCLNNRFVDYIAKVRALEQANRILEEQVSQLSSAGPSRVNDMYEAELNRLRRQVDSLTSEKSTLEMRLENARIDAAKWKNMFEDEQATKQELESDLQGMRKDCDDATLVRLDMERRLETLQEEIEFMKKVHEQEMQELEQRVRSTEIRVDAAPIPDLEEALREVRAQYEDVAKKNREDAEKWYQDKVGKLKIQAVENDEALRAIKNELSEYRKTVQTLHLEIDSMRGTNDSLQRNLGDMEDKHAKDLEANEDTIRELKGDYEELKAQMAQQLRQYQDLMDVKMALDIEIATYRKLLEGEETRIGDKIQSMRTSIPVGSLIQQRTMYENLQQETAGARTEEDVETVTTKKVVVKTIETQDGKIVSEMEDVREESSSGHFDC